MLKNYERCLGYVNNFTNFNFYGCLGNVEIAPSVNYGGCLGYVNSLPSVNYGGCLGYVESNLVTNLKCEYHFLDFVNDIIMGIFETFSIF
jgi:hypothetical protein